MTDPKDVKNEEKQDELKDEQLDAASGGVPASKWKGDAKKTLKTAD